MKRIDIADVAQLKNELRKYKTGKKLDIRQFDQAARLAWLGLAVLSPFDPEDPDCHSWLLYLQRPQGLAEHMLVIDEDLLSQMHILDAEQGRYLASIIEQGVQERAAGLTALNRRQFYFDKFFKAEPGST
jgi:hypothetical protein